MQKLSAVSNKDHPPDDQSTEIPARQVEKEKDGGMKLELEGQIREERWRQECLESLERPEEQRVSVCPPMGPQPDSVTWVLME